MFRKIVTSIPNWGLLSGLLLQFVYCGYIKDTAMAGVWL